MKLPDACFGHVITDDEFTRDYLSPLMSGGEEGAGLLKEGGGASQRNIAVFLQDEVGSATLYSVNPLTGKQVYYMGHSVCFRAGFGGSEA